jgi:hypothetical protein
VDRRQVGGDDGRPARHGLEHGESEPLVEGDVSGAPSPAVEARKLLVRHFAEPLHIRARYEPGVAPAACTDDTKLVAVEVGSRETLHETAEILPRLEC